MSPKELLYIDDALGHEQRPAVKPAFAPSPGGAAQSIPA